MHTLAYLSILGEMIIDLNDVAFSLSLVSVFIMLIYKVELLVCLSPLLDRFPNSFLKTCVLAIAILSFLSFLGSWFHISNGSFLLSF